MTLDTGAAPHAVPHGRMHTEVGNAPSSPSVEIIDGLEIGYDRSVLEPRPWTALQGRWAAEVAADAPPGPILELCSGAGHIGLVAARRSGRALVQVDRSDGACAFARQNAVAAGLGARVDVRCLGIDEMSRARERFPVIIADPPYIATEEIGRFPDDPVGAIDGGSDGLDVARACVEAFAALLVPGGFALLQLGRAEQVDAMARHGRADLVLVGRREVAADRQLALFSLRPYPGDENRPTDSAGDLHR